MVNTGTVDITERWLEGYQLPTGVSRLQLWDARLRGFGVIVGLSRRSFVARSYVRGGKGTRRLVTLGHWAPGKLRATDAGVRAGTMSVAMARTAAIQAIGGMQAGGDPAAPAAAAAAIGITLTAAAAVHVDRMRRRDCSASGIATIEREVALHLTRWLDRPLVEITRTEARELHERLTEDSGPYLANRVMRHLRAVWRTAEREHDLPRCPTVAVSWNKERRRQEPVPWDRLPAWRATLERLSPVRRDYQLLVLLTGLRRNDAATARWERVDLGAGTLHLPRPKGGADRAFTIPLSSACVEVLERRRLDNVDDGGWIFPTVAIAGRPCPLCEALGLPPHVAGTAIHLCEAKERPVDRETGERRQILPSPHRLRDTYTSACVEVGGISPFVIDVLTNHRPPRGSVTAGYISLSIDHLAEANERVTAFLLAKMTTAPEPRRLRSVA